MADVNSHINPVYAILDVETTGLSRKRDRVVQIACLKIGIDDSKTTWMRYVNPGMSTEYLQNGFRIHQIPPEFLLKKLRFQDVAESFCAFLKDVDYLVAHNCLFDWDMLCREFEILDIAKKKEDKPKGYVSKLWWEEFYSKNNWLDTLRLAIMCFPNRNTYRLDAIKDLLNIEPQLEIAYALTESDYGGDQWKPEKHDAMYDVLTTYGVLQHCMENSFADLIRDYSLALLDTGLFLDIQRLLIENRTRTKDLLPFAKRSKGYFTTSRPKGKKLGDLSKHFLQQLIFYLKADTSSDDRIILIYEAAILEPQDDLLSQSPSSANADREGNIVNKEEEKRDMKQKDGEGKKVKKLELGKPAYDKEEYNLDCSNPKRPKLSFKNNE